MRTWFKTPPCKNLAAGLFSAILLWSPRAWAATEYASFHGGNGNDYISDVCTDSSGNIYLVGYTTSTNLPANGYSTFNNGGQDGFITKLSPDGKTILFCTYLGGNSTDDVSDVVVDAGGLIYITGHTFSPNFPATPGAYDLSLNGGRDAFVAKLNSTGTVLLYSTYLGGDGWDYGKALDVDAANQMVYVSGFTHGSFPITAGAAQTALGGLGDYFAAKLDLVGNTLVYSTYVGGLYWEGADNIRVRNGQAYIVGGTGSPSPGFPLTGDALDNTNNVLGVDQGCDGTIVVLAADGKSFVYSSFFGPEHSPAGTNFANFVLDSSGAIYAVGFSSEADMITTGDAIQSNFIGGSQDAILVKFSSDFHSVLYSTYLGGTGSDAATDIALDANGDVWITGYTDSPDFPANASSSGGVDTFVMQFSPSCRLSWSDRFGGTADELGNDTGQSVKIAVCAGNRVVVSGSTTSTDFPVTADAGQPTAGGGTHDAFLVLLGPPSPTPTHTPTCTPVPTFMATVTPEVFPEKAFFHILNKIIKSSQGGHVQMVFGLPKSLPVHIICYDLSGRTRNIVKDGWAGPGQQQIDWNVSNLGSGTYIILFKIPGETFRQKIVIVR